MSSIMSSAAYQNGQVGDIIGEDKTQNELTTEDFMQLLVSELTQQDPFEPVKNQDILNQVSTISSMEMNEQLVGTMEQSVAASEELSLTLMAMMTQNDMISGSNMIGKEVTAQLPVADQDSESGEVVMAEVTGIVQSVQINEGVVSLKLDSGEIVSTSDIAEVRDPSIAAVVSDDTTESTDDTESTDETASSDETESTDDSATA